jgi:hypothetical protein
VSPPIASGIDHAGFVLESPRGRIRSRWRRRGDVVDLEVEVPAGSVADLEIDGHPEALPPGTHRISIPAPLPPPSAPATVRAAMDDAALWAQVVDRVHHHRPHWSARAIAAKAAPYLDRPLPAIARIVGLSIPTSEEAALAAALGSLTPSRSIDYGVTHEH